MTENKERHCTFGVRHVAHLAVNLSNKVEESTLKTTTRSIQLRGKRSQACQSIIQPPALTSSSMASSS